MGKDSQLDSQLKAEVEDRSKKEIENQAEGLPVAGGIARNLDNIVASILNNQGGAWNDIFC